MHKYVKHKETGVVKRVPDYLYADFINTNDWENSSVDEYDRKNILSVNDESHEDVAQNVDSKLHKHKKND